VAVGRFFSKYFGFPLSISFHQCSIFLSFIFYWCYEILATDNAVKKNT
jgi:hypothetical protein